MKDLRALRAYPKTLRRRRSQLRQSMQRAGAGGCDGAPGDATAAEVVIDTHRWEERIPALPRVAKVAVRHKPSGAAKPEGLRPSATSTTRKFISSCHPSPGSGTAGLVPKAAPSPHPLPQTDGQSTGNQIPRPVGHQFRGEGAARDDSSAILLGKVAFSLAVAPNSSHRIRATTFIKQFHS